MSGKVNLKQLFQSDAVGGGIIHYDGDNWASFNSMRVFDHIAGLGDGYCDSIVWIFNDDQQPVLGQLGSLSGDGYDFIIQAQPTTAPGSRGGHLVLSPGVGDASNGEVIFVVGAIGGPAAVDMAVLGRDVDGPYFEFTEDADVWLGHGIRESAGNGRLLHFEAQESISAFSRGGELRLSGGVGEATANWHGPVTIYSGSTQAASFDYYHADIDVRVEIEPAGLVATGESAVDVDLNIADVDDVFAVSATYTRGTTISGDKLYGCYAGTPGDYSAAGGDSREVRVAAYTAKTPFNAQSAATISAFYIVGDSSGTNTYDYGLFCRDETLRIGTEAINVNNGPDIEIIAGDGEESGITNGGDIILIAGDGYGGGNDGVVYIPGKLTVDGALDPISVIIQDKVAGDSAYLQSYDGYAVSFVNPGDNFGRIRYNDLTQDWEYSTPNTAGWLSIGTGGGAGEWTQSANTLYPTTATVDTWQFQEDPALGGVLITQEDNTLSSGSGETFTIRAQAATGGGGRGGTLVLQQSAGAFVDGSVDVWDAATPTPNVIMRWLDDGPYCHVPKFAFLSSVVNPTIIHEAIATAGTDLTIQAQPSEDNAGGALILNGGGGSVVSGSFDGGNVEINGGDANGTGGNGGDIQLTPGGGGSASGDDGEVIMIFGSSIVNTTFTTDVTGYVGSIGIVFSQASTNPIITQDGGGLSGDPGDPLTIKAQTGASDAQGGELRLFGGNGTTTFAGGDVVVHGGTSSLGSGGEVQLQSAAGASRIRVDDSHSYLDEDLEVTDDYDIYPTTDGQGSVGTNANRFGLIRGVTVTSGDLAFDDRKCPVCNQEFQVDDELALKVICVEDDDVGHRITKTVPMHQTCCKS